VRGYIESKNLRIREEASKRPKRMAWAEREVLVGRIRGVLEGRGEILLAVLHGGFLESEVFRDVDVAILLALNVGDVIGYVEDLREELERTVGLPVDIQVLNDAPQPSRTRSSPRVGSWLRGRPGWPLG